MDKGKAVRVALVALNGFTALTAVGGGIALATGAEGERFPVDLLADSPFADYFIPGLILASAVGGSATVATLAMLRSLRAGARASLLAGTVLMGWIVGEVLILPPAARSLLEPAYFAVGLTVAALGLRAGWAERRLDVPSSESNLALR